MAGQNRSAWRWTSWHRIPFLQRNSKDTKDNVISPWINQAKTRLCDFDQTFELQSKNRLYCKSGEEVAEPISPAQKMRWHSSSSDSWWDAANSWWRSKWIFKWFFFYSWFRLQSMSIHCKRWRGADTYTSHVIFVMQFTLNKLSSTCLSLSLPHLTLTTSKPSEPTLAAYDLLKKVISLLRHNQKSTTRRRWSNSILEN